MSLLTRFLGRDAVDAVDRDAFVDHFLFNGQAHYLSPAEPPQTMGGSPQEAPPDTFLATFCWYASSLR